MQKVAKRGLCWRITGGLPPLHPLLTFRIRRGGGLIPSGGGKGN